MFVVIGLNTLNVLTMESCFRIFQLKFSDRGIELKEAYLIDKEVFKYHEGDGDFNNYSDAKIWLKGLSTLDGQFVILEVHTKQKTKPKWQAA
jgi:hypothetical protein